MNDARDDSPAVSAESSKIGARWLIPAGILIAWIALISWWTLGFKAFTVYSYAAKLVGPTPYRAPALEVKDHRGEILTLDQLKDNHVLVNFVYTSCGTVCPRTVVKMMRVHKDLEKYIPQRLAMLTVSFDVERDSAESMGAYWRAHGSPEGWTMGVFNPPHFIDAATVASAFGEGVQRDRLGRFSHPGLIFHIDPAGKVVQFFDSAAESSDVVDGVTRVLQ